MTAPGPLTRRAVLTAGLSVVGAGSATRSSAAARTGGAWGSTPIPADLPGVVDLVHETVAAAALAPPVAARLYAAVLVALHDCVAPAAGLTPMVADRIRASRAHAPDPTDATRAAVAVLLPRLLLDATGNPLAEAPVDASGGRSARWGREVAASTLAVTARDGAVDALRRSAGFMPPTGPGDWRPTPPAHGPAVAPYWGRVQTWSPRPALRLPGPPTYSLDLGSGFGQDALAVRDQTVRNTADDLACARFWADGAGTPTPAGHWVALTVQLATDREVSLRRFARTCGALGPALHDAMVCTWAEKYRWLLQRPITYLRERVDPGFQPVLSTPAFPEYPSGHSVLSAAAATVLARQLGGGALVDRTAEPRGLGVRTYAGSRAAAREASYSRLCGGIHFPTGLAHGLELGAAVGAR